MSHLSSWPSTHLFAVMLGDIFAREDNKWEMQSKEGIDAYLTGPADRTKRRQREVLLFLTEAQDGQEEIQFEIK